MFKNASAFLLRDARHAKHDIFLLRISAILPEAFYIIGNAISYYIKKADMIRYHISTNTILPSLAEFMSSVSHPNQNRSV